MQIRGPGSSKVLDYRANALEIRACGLVWSMLVALGAIDPGSNPGRPTTSQPSHSVGSPMRTPSSRLIERVVQGWNPLTVTCQSVLSHPTCPMAPRGIMQWESSSSSAPTGRDGWTPCGRSDIFKAGTPFRRHGIQRYSSRVDKRARGCSEEDDWLRLDAPGGNECLRQW